MTGSVTYLDSSALVKLVVREPESGALRRFVRLGGRHATSALARTEVVRAVRLHGPAAVGRARALLATVDLIAVDDVLLDAAGTLDPADVRSLDAIHLSSALALAEDLAVVVTYDARMAAAARELGLAVASPS